MASPSPRDRLQPALLDRLTDDDPASSAEVDERRVMTKSQLRAAVLRDLGWLFNAVQPLGAAGEGHMHAAASVLNYGLPPVSGQLASKIDVGQIELELRTAILRFEPRILEHELSVRAVESASVLDSHNVIEFEIRGWLWAQPVPLELLLRTSLDLEAGQVEVRERGGVTSAAAAAAAPLGGARP
jgi:type VI secretion system protein ImpF